MRAADHDAQLVALVDSTLAAVVDRLEPRLVAIEAALAGGAR